MKKLDPAPNNEYELAVINLFVREDRRERMRLFQERRRDELLLAFHEGKVVDREAAIPIVGAASTYDATLALLKRHGATDECYAISSLGDLDRRMHSLSAALRDAFGSCVETVLYCPGTTVAYYEGGGYAGRYVLHRKKK